MGNWLAGGSSEELSGGSSEELSGGLSYLTSVPAHKLEEFIQANLTPNEECLKLIDQDVDDISNFLLSSEITVVRVAKVRPRFGARALDPRRVCSPPIPPLQPCPCHGGGAEHCSTPGTSQGFSPSEDTKADSAGAQATARSSSAWLHDSGRLLHLSVPQSPGLQSEGQPRPLFRVL